MTIYSPELQRALDELSKHEGMGYFACLTRRENEILEQLSQGLSNREIAVVSGIKEVTVKLHVRNLCQKLGVKNRTQAALIAHGINLKHLN